MEKNITIRTTDRVLAEQLHDEMYHWFVEHINFTWNNGAWELSIDAKDYDIDGFVKKLQTSDIFCAGKFSYEVENA